MKNFAFYFLGCLTGAFLIIWNDFSNQVLDNDEYGNPYDLEGLTMLNQEGGCISSNSLIIFQNLTNGIALANVVDSDMLVLLLDNKGRLFYDSEKIKIPNQKCARQIGVYTYETKAEYQRTVPAVSIK